MRKQLLAITIVTAIAQGAAFGKLWVTARIFGVSADLDGYNLALVLPALFSGVLSGVVQTGLFPVRARLAATCEAATVSRFERSVVVLLLVTGLVLAALLLAAARWLQPWIAPGASPLVWNALGLVWPYAACLVAFNAVGDALGYLLAFRDRYVYAAAAPIGNAALAVIILLAWPQGLLSLALGTLLGLAFQVALCLLALQRTGFRWLGPLPAWADIRQQWGDLVRLGIWILPGTFFSNLLVALPPAMLARYGEGAVSAFGYAYRLHLSAVQLLVMASSPIILARFSDLAAHRNERAIGHFLGMAERLSALIGCVAVALVAFLGPAALGTVFGGHFDAAAAQRVGIHWLWLTIGMAPALLGNVYAKLWQAKGRAGQLSLIAFASLLVFFVGSLGLAWPLREYSIAAALSTSSAGVTVVFWWLLRRSSYATGVNGPALNRMDLVQ